MVKAKRVGKRALSLFMAILMTASIFGGLGDVFGIQDMLATTADAAVVDSSTKLLNGSWTPDDWLYPQNGKWMGTWVDFAVKDKSKYTQRMSSTEFSNTSKILPFNANVGRTGDNVTKIYNNSPFANVRYKSFLKYFNKNSDKHRKISQDGALWDYNNTIGGDIVTNSGNMAYGNMVGDSIRSYPIAYIKGSKASKVQTNSSGGSVFNVTGPKGTKRPEMGYTDEGWSIKEEPDMGNYGSKLYSAAYRFRKGGGGSNADSKRYVYNLVPRSTEDGEISGDGITAYIPLSIVNEVQSGKSNYVALSPSFSDGVLGGVPDSIREGIDVSIRSKYQYVPPISTTGSNKTIYFTTEKVSPIDYYAIPANNIIPNTSWGTNFPSNSKGWIWTLGDKAWVKRTSYTYNPADIFLQGDVYSAAKVKDMLEGKEADKSTCTFTFTENGGGTLVYKPREDGGGYAESSTWHFQETPLCGKAAEAEGYTIPSDSSLWYAGGTIGSAGTRYWPGKLFTYVQKNGAESVEEDSNGKPLEEYDVWWEVGDLVVNSHNIESPEVPTSCILTIFRNILKNAEGDLSVTDKGTTTRYQSCAGPMFSGQTNVGQSTGLDYKINVVLVPKGTAVNTTKNYTSDKTGKKFLVAQYDIDMLNQGVTQTRYAKSEAVSSQYPYVVSGQKQFVDGRDSVVVSTQLLSYIYGYANSAYSESVKILDGVDSDIYLQSVDAYTGKTLLSGGLDVGDADIMIGSRYMKSLAEPGSLDSNGFIDKLLAWNTGIGSKGSNLTGVVPISTSAYEYITNDGMVNANGRLVGIAENRYVAKGVIPWDTGVRYVAKGASSVRYSAWGAGTQFIGDIKAVLPIAVNTRTWTNGSFGTTGGHIYYSDDSTDPSVVANGALNTGDGNGTHPGNYTSREFQEPCDLHYYAVAEKGYYLQWYRNITGVAEEYKGSPVAEIDGKKVYDLSDILPRSEAGAEVYLTFNFTNGETPTPTPGVVDIETADLYNITWDYNYDGGGKTTGLFGPGEKKEESSEGGGDSTGGEGEEAPGDTETKSEGTVAISIEFTVPQDPERPGYVFKGWSLDKDADIHGTYPKHDELEDPKHHETFFAIWEPIQVSFNWDANGGQGGSTTKQDFGTSLVPGKIPNRIGYAFTGWYYDKDCTMPLTADTIIDEDLYKLQGSSHQIYNYESVTYYAGWEADDVEVVYVDNRTGHMETTVQQYKYDGILKKLPGIDSHEGWHFVDWEGAADGAKLNNVTCEQIPINADKDGEFVHHNKWQLTLNAVWSQQTTNYRVYFNMDDFNNNDGARPTKATVALISSETGAEVDRMTVNLPSTDQYYSQLFPNKYKITINDTTTEPIVYTTQLVDYTDIQGNTFTIDDPHATNGNISVSAIDPAATKPETVYKYAINNSTRMTNMDEGEPNGGGDGVKMVPQYSTSITLAHNKVTTGRDIKYTIKWEDNSDEAAKRPSSIMLQLYADGKAITSDRGRVMVNAGMCDVSSDGNSWSYIFQDFEKYDHGKVIKYSAAVVNDNGSGNYNKNGYKVSYQPSGASHGETGATLSRTRELVNPTITIQWNDFNNRDGQRPEEVTIQLIAKVWNPEGNYYDSNIVDTYTFSGESSTDDEWSHTFTNKEKYANGKEIIYSTDITGDLSWYDNAVMGEDKEYVEYYTKNISGESNTGARMTLTKKSELCDVPFTIEWKDGHNVDGLRPQTVKVRLYADNKPVEDPKGRKIVEGSTTGSFWTGTYYNMPRYRAGSEGEEIVYSIRVEQNDSDQPIYNNYIAYYTDNMGQHTSNAEQSIRPYVALKHGQETDDYTVTINWDDSSNRNGYRPDKVTIELEGYIWNNDHKTWETKYVDHFTFRWPAYNVHDDVWQYTFKNMYVNYNGQPIVYRAKVVSDLNSQIDSDIGDQLYTWTASELDITISQKIERKNVEAHIEWADNNNNDKIRPTTVIAKLYANGEPVKGLDAEKILNQADFDDEWTVTFKDLPVYEQNREGVEIVYTIEVIEAPGNPLYGTYNVMSNGEEETLVRYVATYRGLNDDGSMRETDKLSESKYPYVKLSHNDEQGTMKLYATWHDEENIDGLRPTQVLADIYKQVGNADPVYIKTVAITEGVDTSWSYTMRDLPVMEGGESVLYTARISDEFKQTLADQEYTVSLEINNIHLYHTPRTGTVTGSVVWNDNNNNDNLRPDSFNVTLVKNGVPTDQTIEVKSEVSEWRFTGINKNYIKDGVAGTPVVYSFLIEEPDGYKITYTPETTNAITSNGEANEEEQGGSISVNMTHIADTKSVPIRIEWNDASDNAGVRPDSVHVQLYADGVVVPDKRIEVSGEGNIWTIDVNDLPAYNNGKPIYYTAKLDDNLNAAGYTDLSAGTVIYLSREPVVADMYVSFRFDDNRNADGKRPDGVYGILTADGVPVNDSKYKHTFYYDADGHVNQYFTGLPVYSANGKYIEYNIEIDFDDDIFGGDSADYIYSTSRNVTLDPLNNNANQVVVTLKKLADTRTVYGDILWFDANNQRGHRPETIDINVKNNVTSDYSIYTLDSVSGDVYDRDGNVVGECSVSEWGTDGASRWHYSISGLRKNAIFENGESRLISYSITVDTTEIAPFYPVVNDGKNMNASLVSDTYADDVEDSTQNYEVRINWLDNNNNWGYRPNARGTEVTLYANGVKYKVQHIGMEDTTPGNDSSWDIVFKDLPTMLNGVPVVYSANIPAVQTYTKEVTLLDYNLASIDMTQSVGFKFDLNWIDENNDDGVRPSDVTLDILADGVKVDSITLEGADGENKWNGSIADLPVWNAVDPTIPVKYTFVWSDATTGKLLDNRYFPADKEGNPISGEDLFYQTSAKEWGVNSPDAGYDLASGGYTWSATLIRDRDRTGASVNINIDDDTDRDGLRPDTIKVQLYADGVAYGDPVEIDTSNPDNTGYTYSWSELPENKGGKPIKYTVDIISDVAPYTKTIDETGTKIDLYYSPERISVLTNVIWDDKSEVHIQYNSLGTEIGRLYGIERTDVYNQLMADGVDIGESVFQVADQSMTVRTIEWTDLLRYKDGGTPIEYNFRVFSEGLDKLLNEKGYTIEYGENGPYDYTATISHTKFTVTGTVYEQFGDLGDKILAPGAKVTVYVLDPDTNNYVSVGHAVADENGRFSIDGVPNGVLTVRAIITDENGFQKAGTIPLIMDKTDKDVEVIINSIPSNDDNYRYSATGNAAYQTDKTNPVTIHSVPAGSIVLLYRVTEDGTTELAGAERTDSNGNYKFENLKSGSYILNYVFNYGENSGTYTYDGMDITTQFPTSNPFVINGADVEWPQAIKQVSLELTPDDPDNPTPTPEPTPEPPKPTVVGGSVLWLDGDTDDSNNDPVVGAKVYVYTADENFYEVGRDVTDENGKWSVEGLPVGNYTAVVSLQGSQSRVVQFEITQADYEKGTYTVGTQYFDKNSAGNTSTIKGVVLDNDGNPTKTLVQLLDADGNIISVQYTDGKGRYEFIVPSGYTYEVKALDVSTIKETIDVGDPDESHTTIDKYIISGDVVDSDGNHVDGATVVIYKEGPEGEFTQIEAATLTNGDGHYKVEVPTGGNYRVVAYKDGDKLYDRNTTVGYKSYEPVVTVDEDNMHIHGDESYDQIRLIDHTTGVVRVIKTQLNGEDYDFDVPKGYYEIEITQNGEKKTYWVNDPADGNIEITHTVTVEGDVLNEKGEPVVGAIVTLRDADGNVVGKPVTILDGHYKFENLPKGEYTVDIEYPTTGKVLFDKTTQEEDKDGKKYPIGITPGDTWRWDVNAIQISGTLTDQDGKPITIGRPEDAIVIIQDKTNPDNVYVATVKPDGTWVSGVSEGNYEVKAVVSVDDTHIYNSNETYDITVNKDPIDGIDFTVNVDKITGTVIKDADGNPIEGAEVVIKYPDGTELPSDGIKTDENGNFEVPVFPDDYVITVVVPGKNDGDEPIISDPVNVTVKGDTDVTITVDAPVYVSGTVTNPDGTPAADAVVYYIKEDGTQGEVFTNKDGKYEIPLYSDDIGKDITIQASAAGMTSDPIVLNVTTDTTQDITLNDIDNRDSMKTITGVVTDNEGKRLPNSIVKLVYGNDKVKTFYTSTDGDGNYRFYVPDGTYYLTAEFKSGDMVYMSNAETEVEVVGKNVVQNLVVSVAYKTIVKVIDTEGNPVSGAIIKYTGQISGEGKTADNGIAYMSIPAGNYIFTAEKGSRKSNELNVTIERNTEVTIVIPAGALNPDQPIEVFPKDHMISGYVFDPDGKPVQGADVTLYKFNDITEEWGKVDAMKSEADGYYAFTGLDDGKYKVDISYTKTGDVPKENINKGNLYIDGYAQDTAGNPYVGATVNLYDEYGDLVQQVQTDGNGYYKFESLDDGKYSVEIIPATGEGSSTTDNVEPKSDNMTISGVVTDVNGRPVNGATVVITGENGGKYTQVTGPDGTYNFTVPYDDYKMSITYLDSTVIDTETYVRPDEPDAPWLNGDRYTVMGTVVDNDGNPVEGATVILRDDSGKEIDRQITGEDGKYKFEDLDRGYYTVEILWKGDIIIIPIEPIDPTPEPDPDLREKMYVAGKVITDHGRLLSGADVFVNTIPGAGQTAQVVTQTKTGDNGLFKTERIDKGAYSVSGSYTHEYGTNQAQGTVPVANKTTTDVILVVVLSYNKDIDGDGIDETIYAGEDDVFGTPDDHYPYDIDKDGEPDIDVSVGKDGKPGTPDDYYPWDSDGDGQDDTNVFIGEDGIPGTEDDWYPHDTDGDGKTDGINDKVYVGPDGKPGTDDDWYPFDADGNGVIDKPTDKVDVGPDGIPNTPDDTYVRDNNGDGDTDDVCDLVHVGEDGIPGTEDDWYLGEDGNKVYPNLTLTFVGNGGFVNGKEVLKVKKEDLKTLPIATRFGYTFEGWHTPDGVLISNIKDLDKITEPTTITAWWKNDGSINPGDVYRVTFSDGNGNMVTRQFQMNTLAVAPNFTRPGYKVTGWKDALGNVIDLSKPLNKDITLYAIWNEEDPGSWYPWDTNKDGDLDDPDDRVNIGDDDTKGTEDDWYVWDTNKDGDKDDPTDKVYIGPDGIPGTPDDWYQFDANGDGDLDDPNDKVFVGPDGIPGTEDDWYITDKDGDGNPDVVIVGPDGIPGTDDDYISNEWYPWDTNKDGDLDDANDRVNIGDDGIKGTPDDWYVHDTNGDGDVDDVDDKVFIGPDGIPGTEDDLYHADIDGDGKKEDIYVGPDGLPSTPDDWYKWDTNKDGDLDDPNDKVFVGEDGLPGTDDDWYIGDLDGDGKPDIIIVGPDGIPGTDDDYISDKWYPWDTNKDGDLNDVNDRVNIGDDNKKGTEDDWYIADTNGDGDTTDPTDIVYIGKDGIPGTSDDWYLHDTNKDGDLDDANDKVYVGEDGLPNTTDDVYNADVDGDGKNETIHVGNDGKPNTEDDWYKYDTNRDGDTDDTCDIVHVGPDGLPGTDDDWYILDLDGDGTDDIVIIGPDGKPGTDDDYIDDKWYPWDTNKDGDLNDFTDRVNVGDDGIKGTPDDWFQWDTNKDGDYTDKDDIVYIGNDGIPGTEDDWYRYDTNGDGDTDDPNDIVFVGPDGIPGTEDDWYPFDANGDGDTTDPDDKVYVGPDGKPGTDDDWYKTDVDGDGKNDVVHVGDDGKPGTPDDWYEFDTNGDGDTDDDNDKVYVGPDGKPGTEDDWYNADVDGDGDDEVIHVGPDGKPGTPDDWYEYDANGDGDTDDDDDKVYVGPDGKPGTPDDWFKDDVDDDGVIDIIIVGPDGIPGTDDDIVINGKKTITVTVDDGFGHKTYVNVPAGTEIGTIDHPLVSGYEFLNWASPDGKNLPNTTQVFDPMTIVAVWEYKGASAWLNTEDHFAYVSGYPNGKVGPTDNITRAEVCQIFYRLLRDDVRAQYEVKGKQVFKDVSPKSWYATAVNTLQNMGVVSGVGNNTFLPDKKITRAEIATIASRMDKLEPVGNNFSDVPANAWYAKYVQSAYNKGWVSGRGDGKFYPNANCTRAEFMTIVNNITGRKPTKESILVHEKDMKKWPDNANKNAWYYVAVQEATNSHIYRIWNNREEWVTLGLKEK